MEKKNINTDEAVNTAEVLTPQVEIRKIATEFHEFSAEAMQRISDLQSKVEALEEIVENALSAKASDIPVADPSAPATPRLKGEAFTVKGKKYRSRFAEFFHEGKTITEDELLSDLSLQKDLVEMGSGVLEQI